jgi:hypothetical protein
MWRYNRGLTVTLIPHRTAFSLAVRRCKATTLVVAAQIVHVTLTTSQLVSHGQVGAGIALLFPS